jgi:hypothetical protein
MTGFRVMMPARQSSVTLAKPDTLSAEAICSSSWSFSTGFVRKAKAPLFVAVTASGIVPCAVRRITGRAG